MKKDDQRTKLTKIMIKNAFLELIAYKLVFSWFW